MGGCRDFADRRKNPFFQRPTSAINTSKPITGDAPLPKSLLSGPTLANVAATARVSLATVDRVVNARPGVSERTRARVLAAAETLGYLLPADAAARPVHLAFVLPDGTNAFVHELAQQAVDQAALLDKVSVTVDLVPGFDAAALAGAVQRLRGSVDGMAVMAPDHPLVREAVRALVDGGLPVATLGSDVRTVGHLGYVGIDDMQAGRLAGFLLGRLIQKPRAQVAFFAGSLSYRGHQEREMGFRQILREEFPHLEIVAQCEVQDSRAMAEREMLHLLDRHPGIDAVYNAGGGTAGIAAALRARERGAAIIFVAHDATASNKALLLDGTLDAVLDQNARLEIREALSTLVHAARGQPYRMVPPRLQVIFRENLPSG